MEERYQFHILDYVVFAGTVLISLGIGLYFAIAGRKKNVSNEEYLMGGRSMHLLPVAISLLVSFVSTIGILGNPAEIYAYGTQFMLNSVAQIIGMVCGTYLFVPLYYPLRITSVFEYLDMRFGARYLELLSVFLACLTTVLFNAVLLYAPCMAFESVSGFPAWASVIISGLSVTIYTTLGGIKAVVWTDVFQAIIIFAGLIAIVAKGTYEVGSISEVWKINNDWNRVEFFNFNIDPRERLSFWSVLMMNSVLWMTVASSQPSVQRFMALPSLTQAKLSTLIIIPGFILSGTLTCSVGATAFAYYAKKGCDPLWSGTISSPNEIFPYFVMDVLNIPSLPGLFIACIFSASFSSISSSFNAMAAMVWENGLKRHYGHLPSTRQAHILKGITLINGLLSIAATFIIMQLSGTIIQVTFSVIGAIGGPLIGALYVGGLFPKAGAKGTTIGIVISLLFCCWLSIGATLSGHYTPPLPGPVHNCTNMLYTGTLEQVNGSNILIISSNNSINMSSATTWLPENTPPAVMVQKVVSNISEGHILHQMPSSQSKSFRTGLEGFYSISYFYYPTFGMLIVFIISFVTGFIPGFEDARRVPKRLLFPCLRRWYGVKDEKSIDEKSITDKTELQALNGTPNSLHDDITKTDDDVWVLRGEEKPLQPNKLDKAINVNVYMEQKDWN